MPLYLQMIITIILLAVVAYSFIRFTKYCLNNTLSKSDFNKTLVKNAEYTTIDNDGQNIKINPEIYLGSSEIGHQTKTTEEMFSESESKDKDVSQ